MGNCFGGLLSCSCSDLARRHDLWKERFSALDDFRERDQGQLEPSLINGSGEQTGSKQQRKRW
jgi:hypothetical protein